MYRIGEQDTRVVPKDSERLKNTQRDQPTCAARLRLDDTSTEVGALCPPFIADTSSSSASLLPGVGVGREGGQGW